MTLAAIDAGHYDGNANLNKGSRSGTEAVILEETANAIVTQVNAIDNELVDVAQSEGSAAVVVAVQSGQPTTADTLTVGSDIYGVDSGGTIQFALGGTAELSLDALLAAAVASGTENLFWDKIDATHLRIRNADAPQGNIVGGSPSVVLDASSMTNWVFDAGDVNMNTLAGKAAAKQAFAAVALTITTAMITATAVRISFPFTPTTYQAWLVNASGLPQIWSADTFVITGDDIIVSTGTDFANTDVLHIVAYA